jgi:hypothetical protein
MPTDLRSAFLSARMFEELTLCEKLVPKLFLSPVTACAWNILAINSLKHKQTISLVGHPFTQTNKRNSKLYLPSKEWSAPRSFCVLLEKAKN